MWKAGWICFSLMQGPLELEQFRGEHRKHRLRCGPGQFEML